MPGVRATYVGGPTALLDIAGVALLTDPTFDPEGSTYTTPVYTLRKTNGPALDPARLGRVDAILLSHDHHFDNFDRAGRAYSAGRRVITTMAGAERLGETAVGLDARESLDVIGAGGHAVTVTATPARHGPAGGDRGPCIGFVVTAAGAAAPCVYVTGDTVLFEWVVDVSRRFDVDVLVLFAGAARVREVGPAHLTFTAEEAVEAARLFPRARIVPVHCEGWAHFSESRQDIAAAFDRAGLGERLCWLPAGVPIEL